MKIDFQIDKIVLEGIELSPRELGQLKASIESELRQRVDSDGLSTIQDNHQQGLRSESVNLPKQISGRGLGSQIASSVVKGLSE